MVQPITLFTGQWADLSLNEVAGLASGWGYDGLEIACSAEHLDVWRAAEEPNYLAERQEILKRNGLQTWAISNHLTGQAVCDNPIDFRHAGIVRPRVRGRSPTRSRRNEAHSNSREKARRRHGCRFHRLFDLAVRCNVSTGFAIGYRSGLRRFRKALESNHGCLRLRRCSLRARGAPI